MIKPVYCHLAMRNFDSHLPIYEEKQSPLELCINGHRLDDWENNGVRQRVMKLASDYKAPMTLHGPIFGYDPSSKDPVIRELAWKRVMIDMEIAEAIDPEVIVLHGSYNSFVYQYAKQYWIDSSAEFYLKLLEHLPNERTRIAIENIFDVDPAPLCELIQTINSPRLGHCFDIGHFNMFQKNYQADRWLESFSGKLFHLHIHDNHGKEDLHLPPGEGSIDYSALIEALSKQNSHYSVTVEGMSPQANFKAQRFVRNNFPGYGE